jgi:hypothetical protein
MKQNSHFLSTVQVKLGPASLALPASGIAGELRMVHIERAQRSSLDRRLDFWRPFTIECLFFYRDRGGTNGCWPM